MEISNDFKYAYLTIEEFCKFKKLSKRTFYRRWNNKKITLVKFKAKNKKMIKLAMDDFLPNK